MRRARLSRRVGGFRKSLGGWGCALRLGCWPGGCAEALERGGELGCPGPVGVESEVSAAGGADQESSDMQYLVAESGWFGAGEGAGEAQRL